MSQNQKKPSTYADLEALPPEVVGEIIDGDLIVSPRPALLHAMVATQLTADIVGPFQRGRGGPGGWIILSEPELHFGEHVLVPDLAGWRRERMPELPDLPALELAPDWVCEVLSPSTVKVDRARKMRHYARAKVAHVWLVDPAATTLEIYRLDGEGWRLVETYAGEVTIRAEPFDAVELELGGLWSR
ncbi:MAG TPA: Uma2 family endonuclease [Polyangia bacterium]|nr:Uma2 family endonuclease [Polyangia bacterium]